MSVSATAMAMKKRDAEQAGRQHRCEEFSGPLANCSLKLRTHPPEAELAAAGFPSPTIAPMMLAVAAILSAENRYGIDDGKRSFQKMVQRDAAQERISSIARGSTALKPLRAAIVTGKKVKIGRHDDDAECPVAERERDQRCQREDGHGLAGDHVGHEGTLGKPRVDEQRGQDKAEDRARDEPPDGLLTVWTDASTRNAASVWVCSRWTGP